jgi:hypothetical protein
MRASCCRLPLALPALAGVAPHGISADAFRRAFRHWLFRFLSSSLIFAIFFADAIHYAAVSFFDSSPLSFLHFFRRRRQR